jgi:hypothetical protein
MMTAFWPLFIAFLACTSGKKLMAETPMMLALVFFFGYLGPVWSKVFTLPLNSEESPSSSDEGYGHLG